MFNEHEIHNFDLQQHHQMLTVSVHLQLFTLGKMRQVFIHTILGLSLFLISAKIAYSALPTHDNTTIAFMDPCKSNRLSMDVNNNGYITKAEFITNSEKRFTLIDSNNDQILSKKELKQYDNMMNMRRY